MVDSWLTGFVLVLALACCCSAEDGKQRDGKQRMVEQQLQYLEHLDSAESNLEQGDLPAALTELELALTCDIRDTHYPFLDLKTSHATAHYLRACCYAMMDDADAALHSLDHAAINGFRNTKLVASDQRLATVRKRPEFARLLDKFPGSEMTDRFAGKTVSDRTFGVSLQKHRVGNFPKLGEIAPDFEREILGTFSGNLKLSDFRGQKPVVLIFGSFT